MGNGWKNKLKLRLNAWPYGGSCDSAVLGHYHPTTGARVPCHSACAPGGRARHTVPWAVHAGAARAPDTPRVLKSSRVANSSCCGS